MVTTHKPGLAVLAFSLIAVAIGGCSYNEDELRAGQPKPRDSGTEDLPSSPDLSAIVPEGDAGAPGVLPDVPTVGFPLDPIDSSAGTEETAPDMISTVADAGVDGPGAGSDAPPDVGIDSPSDQQTFADSKPDRTDAGVDIRASEVGDATGTLDAADRPNIGPDALDAQDGSPDGSALEVQGKESGDIASAG
jgi:hypothetical protein